MTILLTGAAGFIGYHVAAALLERGETVIGIDNINSYYDQRLKHARLERLLGQPGFTFYRADVADREAVKEIITHHPGIDRIVHLAAQAGVRYSLEAPHEYTHSNIEGHLVILEAARRLPNCKHLVYASSSSVYGANRKQPFSVVDRVDNPVSLYAATKKANELMAHCYSHLYRIPTTGLRFFTVYGPWGRPDMAAYLFVDAVLSGKPIKVFNDGDMRRDFTYIDDIVSGVISVLDHPPQDGGADQLPYRVYNIGNHRSEPLMRFIELIEQATERKAIIQFAPMQPGDVRETFADIDALKRDLGYSPTTAIDQGIPRMVQWHKEYVRQAS